MKQIVRYRFMTIPGKISGDVKITVDDRSSEYVSAYDGGRSTSISLFPVINVTIVRPTETDENGRRIRGQWNINDSLGLTKFTLPIFLRELNQIQRDMETPDLYTYHGTRLELNDAVASKIRRAFMLGNTAVELTATVLEQSDERKIEGIKMKFNNEQSTVLLTINELTALIYNVEHIDIDNLALSLYLTYVDRKKNIHNRDISMSKPVIDIDIPSSQKIDDSKAFEEAPF